MYDDPFPPSSIGKIEVQLLDPLSGRPIKSWIFSERAEITIGRLPDRDIEISDPYVSRNHANLVFDEGEWRLISLGRNGILIANQLVSEHRVSGDVNFRLGVEGPTLRFCQVSEPAGNQKTIMFDALPTMVFQLDERKLQNDVEEIAEGDYFQSLQQRAKMLRLQKQAD